MGKAPKPKMTARSGMHCVPERSRSKDMLTELQRSVFDGGGGGRVRGTSGMSPSRDILEEWWGADRGPRTDPAGPARPAARERRLGRPRQVHSANLSDRGIELPVDHRAFNRSEAYV